jgi:cytosine deaminase
MDLVIRNARLRKQDGLHNIGVREDRIAEIGPKISDSGNKEIDAAGRLVTASYANSHIHVDKAFLATRMGRERGRIWDESLDQTIPFKREYTQEQLWASGSHVVEMAASHGTTLLRGFVDVDTVAGLRPLEVALELKKHYADVMEIQVCAFPQEAILRDPGTEDLLVRAMEMGADVVGGLPWIEWSDEAMKKHIDIVFDIANQFGRNIHMLIDNNNDPMSRSIEFLADKIIREGFDGCVAAGHVEALCVYDDVHASRVIQMIGEAGIHIVSNPHISLSGRGRLNRQPIPRGLTRVKELLEGGVPVSCAQDDVMDPFYNFGKMDQLEVGLFMAHAAHFTGPDELETVYDMISVNAARAMGVEDFGLEVGNRADMVILDADSVWNAFRLRPNCLYVIKGGKITAEAQTQRQVLRSGYLEPLVLEKNSEMSLISPI